MMDEEEAADWSVRDVKEWLNSKGFGEYVDLLCNKHRIDGQVTTSDGIHLFVLKMLHRERG